MSSSLHILTPEGVEFSLALAGPFLRCLAWAIDLACIVTATSVVGALLAIIKPVLPSYSSAMGIVLYFCISTGYGILLEWSWRGQTVGKRLLGLRVTHSQGLRLKFSQIALRNLLRAVDGLPLLYAVGGMACLCSTKQQRLGDYAAGTVVIRHVKQPPADLASVHASKFNSFRAYSSLEARLRQRVSPAQASLALQALVRRDDLDPEARTNLFSELAAFYRGLVSFPEDATFALTDEQYVRNVVETLFRPRGVTATPSPSPLQPQRQTHPPATG